MSIAGVYCIENIYNGKIYIGSAFNAHARVLAHFGLLRKGKSHNNHLQASYDKYGKDAFVGYIIELCEKGMVKEREQFWIDNTSCLITGYNKSGKVIDNSGWNHSEELKNKLSVNRMGDKNPMYGKVPSNETKEMLRLSSTGRRHRQQAKDKMIKHRANNKQNYVGSKCGKAILNEKQVYEIKILLSKGNLLTKIAAEFKVSPITISGIFENRRWSHVICTELEEYKKTYKPFSRHTGELNNKSKLTEKQVKEIRAISGKSYAAISRIYNVSDVLISNIIKMKIWKNVV